MPKLPIDYSKSLIYKLCCNDLNITDIYIGSTTNFSKRKGQHRQNCNNENIVGYNRKLYRVIRDNGGWINWDMILIENNLNVNNKLELHKKERMYIENLKPTLNYSIPTRTSKEYYNDNKVVLREQKKEYRQKNKDAIKEHNKQYYNDNKEIINEKRKDYCKNNKDKINQKAKDYYYDNKEQKLEYQKEYQQKNKDAIKQQKKEYYNNNKDIINEKSKQKITCSCGSIINKYKIKRHERTIKHLDYIKSI